MLKTQSQKLSNMISSHTTLSRTQLHKAAKPIAHYGQQYTPHDTTVNQTVYTDIPLSELNGSKLNMPRLQEWGTRPKTQQKKIRKKLLQSASRGFQNTLYGTVSSKRLDLTHSSKGHRLDSASNDIRSSHEDFKTKMDYLKTQVMQYNEFKQDPQLLNQSNIQNEINLMISQVKQ